MNVLNMTCKSSESLPSTVCVGFLFLFFFFVIRRDMSLPSHPFHPSAALAPVIMVPLGRRVRAPGPVSAHPPLFLPVPLQRCRLPLAALGSLSAISSHQRWCNKGDTWRNVWLVAVATATEKTWKIWKEWDSHVGKQAYSLCKEVT